MRGFHPGPEDRPLCTSSRIVYKHEEIVIGKNKGRSVPVSGIPHQMVNLQESSVVIETEESYTSQTSFLDHEMQGLRKKQESPLPDARIKNWPVIVQIHSSGECHKKKQFEFQKMAKAI
ncbi:hypothetical protein [Dubosiella newyorkensis]|uniref:hypothetical protein n=1 Tax=Dubosiella newyorkensis TaxID=1862672 RepID=UPI003F67A21E